MSYTDRRSHDPFAPPPPVDSEPTTADTHPAEKIGDETLLEPTLTTLPSDLDDLDKHLDGLKLAQLKAFADERDLPTYGTKAEVAERIMGWQIDQGLTVDTDDEDSDGDAEGT